MKLKFKKLFKYNCFRENEFDISVLNKLSFGQLEGEKDGRLNSTTFFPTQKIKTLLDKRYNYVLSPKGVGKSAIFSGLEKKFISESLFDYKGHSIIPINEAFGGESEYLDPQKFKIDSGRSNYALNWGMYLLMKLIEDIINNHSQKENFDSLKSSIVKIEGFKDRFQLYNLLDIVNDLNIGLVFNVSGQKIEVHPNFKYNRKLEKLSINAVLKTIDKFYKENNLEALIVIDRIDSFVNKQSFEIQKNYVQGLIDCVEELSFLDNIDVMLFLRTDLFYAYDIKFEFDKVKERKIELNWEEAEVMNFITNRFLSNEYVFENFVGYIHDMNKNIDLPKSKLKRFFYSFREKITDYFINYIKTNDFNLSVASGFIHIFYRPR